MPGYPISPYLLRPFNESEVSQAADAAQRRRIRSFNKELSGVRALVEQAFGRLKARFPSLKEIGTPDDMRELYNAVAAMMVLHNLCIDLNDEPSSIFSYDRERDRELDVEEAMHRARAGLDENGVLIPGVIPGWETDRWLRQEGYTRRQDLMEHVLARQ